MKELETTEILDEIERDKVIAFYQDTTMREAVRKILLWGIYNSGTLVPGQGANPKQNFLLSIAENTTLDDAKMGQELRAAWWGIAQIENSFGKMAEIKRPEEVKAEEVNPAE
jgi:hypothetical protein